MNILLTISLAVMLNINEYQVLPVPELKILLKKESRDLLDFNYQMEHSNALVYFLKSGQVILMPNHLYDKEKGILFKNRKVFDSFVKAGYFPIENSNASVGEFFQTEILGVNEKISEMRRYLSDLYGLDTHSGTLTQILTKAQERTHIIKISHKEYIYRNLLLGEYLRESFDGKWILLKVYGTFNPYYIPGIIKNDDSVINLLDISNVYFQAKEYSLEDFLKYPSVKKPVLKFGSLRFKETFSEYKKID